MARLSAHGTEIARFEKLEGASADRDVLERRTRYSVRSDGAIMKEYSVLFAAGPYSPQRWHSYGWKLAARPKVARPLEHLRPALLASGWRELTA